MWRGLSCTGSLIGRSYEVKAEGKVTCFPMMPIQAIDGVVMTKE